MISAAHSYRLVAAFLYRMPERSPIAEAAWERAGFDDVTEASDLGRLPAAGLISARDRAIDAIMTGTDFPVARSKAVDAIDAAVRAALGDVKN